jgi:hypothetical protein
VRRILPDCRPSAGLGRDRAGHSPAGFQVSGLALAAASYPYRAGVATRPLAVTAPRCGRDRAAGPESITAGPYCPCG